MITKLKTYALTHPLLTICALFTTAILVIFLLAKTIEKRSEVRLYQLENILKSGITNQRVVSPWETPIEVIDSVVHVSGVDRFSCKRADLIAARCDGGFLTKAI